MSLDVSMHSKTPVKRKDTVLNYGNTRPVYTIEELNTYFPDLDEETKQSFLKSSENYMEEMTDEVFSWNITHNLTEMASKVPIKFRTCNTTLYTVAWHPEDIFEGKITGKKIKPFLRIGLDYLYSHKEELSKFNPGNGWGSYGGLVEFIENYYKACCMFPDSIISTWA